MPKLEQVIELVRPEAHLLEKINMTQRTMQLQVPHLTSDTEVLHYLNSKRLLDNLYDILNSATPTEQKKEELIHLLAQRWLEIQGTSYSYCEQPRDLLNQLCFAVALYISPLPEDLSECDDWQVGEGPYFLLMPGLDACKDIVLGTNIHQYQFHEFILSEDNKRYIPVYDVLNFYFHSSALKPVHTVFSDQQMEEEKLDKKNDALTNSEIVQLTQHSSLTDSIMSNLSVLKDPNSSFFNRLSQLADGLFAGSSHGGSGAVDNAAAEANEAIIQFFEYWDSLTVASQHYFLQKVPELRDIFQRLRDPVSISEQGVNYCVGVTGGDLRFIARDNRNQLQNETNTKLQAAVHNLLAKLETAIKQPKYNLNPVQKNKKPLVSQIINMRPDEQAYLIRTYFNMDYPNFLFYAFEQQPDMVPTFIKAFQNSQYKQQLFQQRNRNGMTLLMMAAQTYPEALQTLLLSYLERNNTLIKDEIIIIAQRHPETLPQLLAVIAMLEKNEQLHLLTGRDSNNTTFIMSLMETDTAAFLQLCELIKTFSVDDIENILGLKNHKENTLLMAAFLDYPNAIAPLLALFDRCHPQKKNEWISHCNQSGLNLLSLALNSDTHYFNIIANAAANMPISSLKKVLASNTGSFFLRASYQPIEKFRASISLLNKFPPEEQIDFILERDQQNNNLLLSAMLHQQIPPAWLFNKLIRISPTVLFDLLTTKNQDGFAPLTLALTQQQQYYVYIVNLIYKLTAEQQQLVWGQVDINGYSTPLLAAMLAPQHLPSMLKHVDENTLLASLKQQDHYGACFLHLISGFQPELLPNLIAKIKLMSVEQRFQLLRQCNQQGDNLLSWMLIQDQNLLSHFFELMPGFSITQQLELITQRNHQNQHAVTLAYNRNIESLDHFLNLIDDFNGGKKDVVLAALPVSHWFDLLSLACTNTVDFERLYASYRIAHKNDSTALGKLLNYCDVHNNNLMILILRHNPSLVSSLIRDVKSLSDEKIQRAVMLQTNNQGETVLSLAEKHSSDHIVSTLHAFSKRLDKQSTKQMMVWGEIKMQSANILISPEMIEQQNNAREFLKKLDERDEQDNNLLGQIIIRMPHYFPVAIKKMQGLLSADQINQLLTHSNQKGLNCYSLASKQDQAAFLCDHIQSITNSWANKQKEAHRLESVEGESAELETAIRDGEVNICQKFIRSTRTLPIDTVVAIMLRNKQALMNALTSNNKSIKGLFNQWLFSIPQARCYDILSQCPSDFILSLLDNDINVFDSLPLHYQAQLLSKRDEQNILVKSLTNNHPCHKKLMNRFKLFTAQQQFTLLLTREANTTLLHALVTYPLFLKEVLSDLSRLSYGCQFALLSHVDQHNCTLLDYLGNMPDLYEQVLNLYDNLGLNKQIQLYSQTSGAQNLSLLLIAPIQFRQRMVEQLLKFPQEAKINLLLDMINKDKNSLKVLLDTLPHMQVQILNMLQLLPKPVLGSLVIPQTETDESLIRWMLHSPHAHLKNSALSFMTSLAKADLSIIYKHKNSSGDNLLQEIAKNFPLLFKPAFSIFMNLSTESKIDLLLERNTHGKSLFSDLIDYKCFDHFDNLCRTISQFPGDKQVQILTVSGIVPTKPTTRWVEVLYRAPQCESFINLLNNKCFFNPMFHLLQCLPPQVQVTILTNKSSLGKTILDEVNQPERAQLKLVLKHAYALVKARKLLNKMSAKIPNDHVFGPEYHLYQDLTNRLDLYQNTYHKNPKHMFDLTEGWIHDIEAALPQIERKYSSTNVLKTCLKFAGSVVIPPYGGYNLYKKATSNRHVLFRSDQQRILYDIEDVGAEFKKIGKAFIANS